MENKKIMISVIIPVYNVEKYIRQCVDSVLNQTINEIEILLIDDGSTDNSGIICDDYGKKEKNIKVFHKKNGGLSSARNFGINYASGEYISFIDSDDYILPQMLEKLLSMCINTKSKIAACDYYNVYDEKLEKVNETMKTYVYSSKEFFKKILTENGRIEMCAVNKLYHKSIFASKNNRFPEGKLFEDLGSTYKYIFSVDKIVYINKGYYCYRRARKGSITATWNNEREYDRIYMSENMVQYIKQNIPELYGDALAFKFMNTYLTSINLMIQTNSFQDEIYKLAQQDISKNIKYLLKSNLPFVKKAQIIISISNYNFYKKIFNYLK